MNSEMLQEFKAQTNDKKFKVEMHENTVINDGGVAEDFLKHPQWIKITKQLEAVYARLVSRLDSVETLKEMYRVQAEMKVIKLLLNNPKGYIEKTKELHRRKSRWKKQ